MDTPLFTPLSPEVSVAPQLGPGDMARVAAAGFRSVIINRPDFEGGADQPASVDVMAAASAAGLRCVYQPVVSGAMTADDVARFAELVNTLPTPVLAYCRTGTRCTVLYQAASAA